MKVLKIIRRVWGYEGCGAMWTFFSDKKRAIASAGENPLHDFSLEEAFHLDNRRRVELGFNKIDFKQFLDCIDASTSCIPPDPRC